MFSFWLKVKVKPGKPVMSSKFRSDDNVTVIETSLKATVSAVSGLMSLVYVLLCTFSFYIIIYCVYYFV